jgi:Domain of unknown function (DUF4136)
MKQVLNKAILPALVGVFLLGCYPAGPEYVEDLDVVYSSYDQEYDFVSQGTYSMPDKIVTDVKIDNGDTTYVYMKAVYATPILAAIDQNMSKLGWEKVSIANDPDVLVSPAAMSTTTVYYSYWYDWWYGSYTTGSMIITIADPNVESAINKTPTVWISASNGLLTGYDDVNRAITGINQAFAQSPYLKTN